MEETVWYLLGGGVWRNRAHNLPWGDSYLSGWSIVTMQEPGPAFVQLMISQGKVEIHVFM